MYGTSGHHPPCHPRFKLCSVIICAASPVCSCVPQRLGLETSREACTVLGSTVAPRHAIRSGRIGSVPTPMGASPARAGRLRESDQVAVGNRFRGGLEGEERNGLPEQRLGAARLGHEFYAGVLGPPVVYLKRPGQTGGAVAHTFWFVSRRRRPSMVNRQNKSAAASAGTCCGCRSQFRASQTLPSIQYEAVGRFRIGA